MIVYFLFFFCESNAESWAYEAMTLSPEELRPQEPLSLPEKYKYKCPKGQNIFSHPSPPHPDTPIGLDKDQKGLTFTQLPSSEHLYSSDPLLCW